MTIIIFLLVIGLLILVHEFGHYVVARLFGIQVDEFALGFPPRLLSWRRHNTQFSLNLLPLGGYVKLLGEDETDEKIKKNKAAFSAQPPYVRLLVVVAGVVLNFLLAGLIFFIGFAVTGISPATISADRFKAAETHYEFFVHEVQDGSAAEQAGIKPGMLIVGVDQQLFRSESSLRDATAAAQGKETTILVHDGKRREIKAVLGEGEAPLGVRAVPALLVKTSLVRALPLALQETYGTLRATVVGVYQLMADLFIEQKVSSAVTGPVGIFTITGTAARLGLPYLLQLVAVLSINLGIINILPFPALDGGRAMFIVLERLLKRKVIRAQIENIIHTVGFIVLILLILAITFRDVDRIR